ncbi:hypothetical protein FRIGORI9N_190008 [Frigoribacterium sp. 9N]|nr:hypothetical protein FRIGORI9N_190008 [Frigoribacterium sp. 9N]
MSAELTLGAEEELHLIDLETGRLSARAPHLLARLPADRYGAELQRTTIETNVPVVTTLDDLRREILTLRRDLVEVTTVEGLAIGAVGTAPRSEVADFELTTTGRYGRMHEQYRLLVDEQLICGLQIHVGVADRDLAVDVAGRIAPGAARPARPERQLALPQRPGHRLREHPLAHLATVAERRGDRPDGRRRRVRPAARRPHRVGRDRRQRHGLLRRPALEPRAHPRAAHLRRLPVGRRRGADRRPLPRRGAPGRDGRRGRPPRPAPGGAAAPGRDVAGGAQRARRRAARPRAAPLAVARGRGGPAARDPAAATTRGVRRLADRVRPRRGHARPGQLGRPAARRLRREGTARRRGRPGRPRDARPRRRARRPGADPRGVPVPCRRRGDRPGTPPPPGLPGRRRLLPAARRDRGPRPRRRAGRLVRTGRSRVRRRRRPPGVPLRPRAPHRHAARVEPPRGRPDPARPGDRGIPPRRLR